MLVRPAAAPIIQFFNVRRSRRLEATEVLKDAEGTFVKFVSRDKLLHSPVTTKCLKLSKKSIKKNLKKLKSKLH